MFRDKIASNLLRKINRTILSRVIVKTPKLEDIAIEYGQLIKEAIPLKRVSEIIPRIQFFGGIESLIDFIEVKIIRAFNLIGLPATRSIIEDLAQDKRIEKVFPDRIMSIVQFPTLDPKGIYFDERKKKYFTSTAWTKKYMGGDIANSKGYRGEGVSVAVIDTGGTKLSRATYHIELHTVMKGQYSDLNGHGCIKNAYVYTSFCGVQKIEDMWNLVDTQPIKTADTDGGELKLFPYEVYTLGQSGVVKVEGIYRCKAKKVRIHTPLGVIEATPWHKFMVIRPMKNIKKGDWHRRWCTGYEILWKRADELVTFKGNNNTDADYLLIKPYDGESWSFKIDPRLAFLAGYFFGDATVIFNNINVKTGKAYANSGKRNEIYAYDNDYNFLSEVAKFCRKLGATSVNIKKNKNEEAYKLSAYGKEFVAKFVPLVINPPINDLEAMRAWIAGFFDAEGYVDFNRKRVKIVNVNRPFLEKLANFLTAIGIPSKVASGGNNKGLYISYHLLVLDTKAFYKFVEPYVIKKKEELTKLAGMNRVHAKIIRRVGGFVALRIKKVEVTNEEDYFYDLTNSSDTTYLASGIVSHNCWVLACIGGKPFTDPYYNVPTEGFAPNCRLISIKALGYVLGMGSESGIIQAMELARKLGAEIINMSLGSEDVPYSPEEDPEIEVVKKLTEDGIIVVCAAGNSGPNPSTINSPGAAEQALTVGALNQFNNTIADFSSRGPVWGLTKPDVCAPGYYIDAPTIGLLDVLEDRKPQRSSWLSGTSMATPHVTGIVTLMAQALKKNGLKLKTEMVKDMMSKYGQVTTKDNSYGWGVPTWEIFERYCSEVLGIKV